ncbi:MAG TPA: ABC transporter ATP-binding protein [Thermoanaerobaculia bacterium]|jgi:ABC-2 type transport system ATP-binding protein/lipopolysaccharide transport system ATP-binding protein|nr:ABC transporter ATP-binding protein [Thermoanaerobaculia bacterium]
MDDLSIRLEGVSLCYRLAKQRIPSLKEYAIHFMRGALSYEKLWALRDIDLTVRRGESLGIIGRNGAGKSTLLKVISRVLKPSRGSAIVNGTISPILEIGAGFDFELTGLENLYLNGLMLGHTKREVAEKVDEIVDFSGLGDFIRSPLRNYSSGMQARLGFAVATAWMPDILILDEVLAVGDLTFTEKCEKRLRRFHDEGTTVLLVSHTPHAILTNCSRCIWLDDGRIRANGDSKEVVDLYLREHGTEPVDHEGGRLPPSA